jgi:WD40 repeat protein
LQLVRHCGAPQAFNFTCANEDHNLYTFDMRKLDRAKTVHKDHVSAVLDVDYSPTGKEFVSGAYDRSMRIFSFNGGHSREIYHTKRMQRIFCVNWSADAKYVLHPPELCATCSHAVRIMLTAHTMAAGAQCCCGLRQHLGGRFTPLRLSITGLCEHVSV